MYTIENNLLHLQLGDQPSRDFCTIQASLPPAAAASKGCNSSLYHCFFLPYDGNGLFFRGLGGASIPGMKA